MIETFDVNSRIIRVKLRSSAVTTGAGLTGLTCESAGLIISTIADNEATATAYTQAGGTIETIATLGTYAAPTATKCRFKEVDSTNHPGLYEIQLADARLSVASAKELVVSISGAANLAQEDLRIQLTRFDLQTATPAVDASASAVASVTGAVGSVASYGTLVADVATAVWAAGTRTLTSFGTLIADIWAGVTTAFLAKFSTQDTGETTPVAGSVAKLAQGSASMTEADIWAYATRTLTQSAAQIAAVVAGSTLTVQRGDTLSAALTGLGSIDGRTKLWFTVKRSLDDADTASIVQIEETAGLLHLNGAAGTAIQGNITVDDASAGDITITLAAAAAAQLPLGSYSYDVQWVTASDEVHTLTAGTARIVADVTRATA